ncbi:MAG: transglycosylase domain-containing protein [Gemmatimonadales bacterium]
MVVATTSALAAIVIVAEALVRARLDGATNGPPALYYRPQLLRAGVTMNRGLIESTLHRLGYERAARGTVGSGEYRLGGRRWTIGFRAFRIQDRFHPGGTVSISLDRHERIVAMYNGQGSRIRTLALEPELIRPSHAARPREQVPVPLAEIPDELVQAALAIEDQRFFNHWGFDLRRVAGALGANVRAGGVVQGASTITQQLAKNLFLSPVRSMLRKIREMAFAMILEVRYGKAEILEAYLNEIYLGQQGSLAIHGVGAAAQFYFDKDVTELSLAESALLAGMIKGPSLYSPSNNPELAVRRRDLVLEVMRDRGLIDDERADAARSEPLGLRRRALPIAGNARYFIDYVNQTSQQTLEHGDRSPVVVFTTLDAALQRAADAAVVRGLESLEQRRPQLLREATPLQAALVAIDPATGEILAMMGGRDYGSSQFNRAVNALRQPGSSFKPIVALAALTGEGGVRYTLASRIEDRPLSYATPAGLWQPQNYDGGFHGAVTLRDAIVRSLNVPFARLGLAVGAEHVAYAAARLGIESHLNPVPSLALGSSEVTLLEMTRAFGVLANGGVMAESRAVMGVMARGEQDIMTSRIRLTRAYNRAEVYLVTSALRDVVESGTGERLRELGFYGEVAAKSGTTNGFRDAWFIGYTPSLAVGVWVGFDDGASVGLPGSAAALPIFARFIIDAVGPFGDARFELPRGLEVVEVNGESGLRAGWGCRGEPELFLRGTGPRESCFGLVTRQRISKRTG